MLESHVQRIESRVVNEKLLLRAAPPNFTREDCRGQPPGLRNGWQGRAAIYFGREFTYHVRCQRGRSWARLCFAVSR
jgi:hypothetical protein